jgi:glycerate kinase
MQVIIAPDKFKGSLTSFQVCNAINAAFAKAGIAGTLYSFPMADGGDGFAAIMKSYLHTETVSCSTVDPLGRTIMAGYEWSEVNSIAIIEMAVASGLVLLSEHERNPLLTSTTGTGILIKDAIDKGAKKIMLGLGGSATNDAGMGILSALGFTFMDKQEEQLSPSGENLLRVHRIVVPRSLPAVTIQVACDVQNTLYGRSGAAYVYGPQKAATPDQVELLDQGLRNFADVLFQCSRRSIAEIPGTGAAGGIAAGLLSFYDVELIQGIGMIVAASGLKEKLPGADLVITGEGRLDNQSEEGKVVGYIAALAGEYGIPCIAVCGQSSLDSVAGNKIGLKDIITLKDDSISVEYAMSEAEALIIEKLSAYLTNQ